MANIIGRIQADGSIVWDGGTSEAKSQNGTASEFDIVNTTDKEWGVSFVLDWFDPYNREKLTVLSSHTLTDSHVVPMPPDDPRFGAGTPLLPTTQQNITPTSIEVYDPTVKLAEHNYRAEFKVNLKANETLRMSYTSQSAYEDTLILGGNSVKAEEPTPPDENCAKTVTVTVGGWGDGSIIYDLHKPSSSPTLTGGVIHGYRLTKSGPGQSVVIDGQTLHAEDFYIKLVASNLSTNTVHLNGWHYQFGIDKNTTRQATGNFRYIKTNAAGTADLGPAQLDLNIHLIDINAGYYGTANYFGEEYRLGIVGGSISGQLSKEGTDVGLEPQLLNHTKGQSTLGGPNIRINTEGSFTSHTNDKNPNLIYDAKGNANGVNVTYIRHGVGGASDAINRQFGSIDFATILKPNKVKNNSTECAEWWMDVEQQVNCDCIEKIGRVSLDKDGNIVKTEIKSQYFDEHSVMSGNKTNASVTGIKSPCSNPVTVKNIEETSCSLKINLSQTQYTITYEDENGCTITPPGFKKPTPTCNENDPRLNPNLNWQWEKTGATHNKPKDSCNVIEKVITIKHKHQIETQKLSVNWYSHCLFMDNLGYITRQVDTDLVTGTRTFSEWDNSHVKFECDTPIRGTFKQIGSDHNGDWFPILVDDGWDLIEQRKNCECNELKIGLNTKEVLHAGLENCYI